MSMRKIIEDAEGSLAESREVDILKDWEERLDETDGEVEINDIINYADEVKGLASRSFGISAKTEAACSKILRQSDILGKAEEEIKKTFVVLRGLAMADRREMENEE